MGRVRPFEQADIPQLVDLCPRAYPESVPYPPAAYFEEFFFRTPCTDEKVRSLVSEADDGRIVGFIAVMPRRFVFNDAPVRVAVATRFMVDPSARSTTAGLDLFNTFLSGSQDLSLADTSNAPGRILWEGFGAKIVWPYGLRWQCTLRPTPSRRLRSALGARKSLRFAAKLATPVFTLLDEAVRADWHRRHPLRTPDATCTEIDSDVIIANVADMAGHRNLRPSYDKDTLDWLIRRAAAKTRYGELKAMGVRDRNGTLLGWFIYYLKCHGVSVLLQLVAKRHAAGTVLDCLIADAAKGKATAVAGRLEPKLSQALASRTDISCQLSPYWMVAHTKDARLMAAIHGGDAVLTRLDGEWSMAFHGDNLESEHVTGGGDEPVRNQAYSTA